MKKKKQNSQKSRRQKPKNHKDGNPETKQQSQKPRRINPNHKDKNNKPERSNPVGDGEGSKRLTQIYFLVTGTYSKQKVTIVR